MSLEHLLNTGEDDANEWMSVSDLMAGLMVIFLFIAIVYIRPITEENKTLAKLQEQLERQNQQVADIATAWQDREKQIYRALELEFRDDLAKWNAEIDRDSLLVRFKSPEVLFRQGDAQLSARFESILADFFPRYTRVLKPFRHHIEELRVDGHTSSEWRSALAQRAYIQNLRLSQGRTRAVVDYVLALKSMQANKPWLQRLLTANGLSSSRLVVDDQGNEIPDRSRRVEFRVRTTVKREINRILESVR